jgi:hypothetical protein
LALLLRRKLFDDMGPDQVPESAPTIMYVDCQTIRSVLFGFPDPPFPYLLPFPDDSKVDLLNSSEEDEQVDVEGQELIDHRLFIVAFRQL